MTLETSAVERLDYIIAATEKYEFDIPVSGKDLTKAFDLIHDVKINLWDNVDATSSILSDTYKIRFIIGGRRNGKNLHHRSGIIKSGVRIK